MVEEISIVFPAYNEEENFAEAARRAAEAAALARISDYEVIFVDDGSTDATAAKVEALSAADRRVRLVRHDGNRGDAEALKSGFDAATKRYGFYTDSDNQFVLKEMKHFRSAVEAYDLGCGVRIYRFDPF